jgi:DegV family protein with EDD domain
MQIVSDRGFDLVPEQFMGLPIHLVPLTLTLGGKSYRSGVDITPEQFYQMLDSTDEFPTTSQPSPGDFADLYRKLAETDPDILSIHISSGLSGTFNAARTGAGMVPEANVTLIDTKTLSCPMGWQVEAALRAKSAGWSIDQIKNLCSRVGAVTEGIFTVPTLKYLIHGGRISHITGLMASLMNIKPVIGVEKERGTYVNLSRERTFTRAINKLAEIAAGLAHGGGLRVQLLHGFNPDAITQLKERLAQIADCTFLPVATVAPVLGAHTGAGLTGMAVAPLKDYPALP